MTKDPITIPVDYTVEERLKSFSTISYQALLSLTIKEIWSVL